ncbi:MAG: hypothetical protein ABSF45_18780 [Terriglobia bacterium]|jgi:hypothetical protein
MKMYFLGWRLTFQLFLAWLCVHVGRLLLQNGLRFCHLFEQGGFVSYRCLTAHVELQSPEGLLYLTWADMEGRVPPRQEASYFAQNGLGNLFAGKR